MQSVFNKKIRHELLEQDNHLVVGFRVNRIEHLVCTGGTRDWCRWYRTRIPQLPPIGTTNPAYTQLNMTRKLFVYRYP